MHIAKILRVIAIALVVNGQGIVIPTYVSRVSWHLLSKIQASFHFNMIEQKICLPISFILVKHGGCRGTEIFTNLFAPHLFVRQTRHLQGH